MIDPNQTFIVVGSLYKVYEKDPWFQWGRADKGEVRYVEGRLCHAVAGTYTYVKPVYCIQSREDKIETDISIWVPVNDSTQ